MSASSGLGTKTGVYRRYVLGMLLAVYLVSLVDRQILAVLLEPIRHDLGLHDVQLGLLSGVAFGLLYAVVAVPLSRLGDRRSRVGVIAGSLVVWSLATALCGAAAGFGQLFAARVLVGTGEAGAGPSSHSLIADYFPPERRGFALGVYSMGIFMGAGLGLSLGGVLLMAWGWRGAFVAAGLPGLLLAVLLGVTVRDPRRSDATVRAPAFGESVRIVTRAGPLLSGAFGLGFSVFAIQSMLNWLPALLARDYAFSPSQAGHALAPVVALFGTAGVLAGGLACDRVGRHAPANSPLLMAAVTFLIVPAGIFGLLSGSARVLIASQAPVFFCSAFVAGPSFALFQARTPPALRAFAAAFAGLVAVILGNAAGPFAAGALSDILRATGSAHPLRDGLIACNAAAAIGSCAYLAAARTLAQQAPDGVVDVTLS